jgi:hypothetical protein
MRSWAVLGLLVAFSETPPSGHDRMPTTPLPNQARVQQARYCVTVLIRSPFTGDRGRGAGHAAPAHPRVRLQRTGRWPLPGTLLAPWRWRCSPFATNGEPRKENPPVSWTGAVCWSLPPMGGRTSCSENRLLLLRLLVGSPPATSLVSRLFRDSLLVPPRSRI